MIYLAGSSLAADEVKSVSHALATQGYSTLHAWTNPDKMRDNETNNWRLCMTQISMASVVVVVVSEEAPLRGAIFEAGYARGLGLPVIVYDQFRYDPKATWMEAPEVTVVGSLHTLFRELGEWAKV